MLIQALDWDLETRLLIADLSPTSYVNLGKSLTFPSLRFLMYKVKG